MNALDRRQLLLALWLMLFGSFAGAAEPVDAPGTLPAAGDSGLPGQQVRQFLNRPSAIVGDEFAPLVAEPSASQEPLRAKPAGSPSPNAEVHLLRQASWRLEQTAHHLECLNLYTRADEVRALADQLRHDARKRQAAVAPTP